MGFSLVYLGPEDRKTDFRDVNPEVRKTILPSFQSFLKNSNGDVNELWEEMKKLSKLPIEKPKVLEFPLSAMMTPYTIGSEEKYKDWPIKPNYSFILQNIKEGKHLVSLFDLESSKIEPHITIPDENIPPKAVELIQYTIGGDHPLRHPRGILEIKNIQKEVPVSLDGKKLGKREAKYGSVLKIGEYSFLIESFEGTELDGWVSKEESFHRMEWPSRDPDGQPIIY